MTDVEEKMRYMAEEILSDDKPQEQRLIRITQALKTAYVMGRDSKK